MATINYQKVQPGDGCSKDLESGTFAGMPAPPAADYSKGGAEFELDAVSTQFAATARLGFVRKVFGLLTAQLLMTVAVSALFMENVSIRNYVLASPGLLTFSFVGSICCIFLCSACKDSHPKNLYCLAAFTLFESMTIGFICALYAARGIGHLVLQAAVLTLAVFVALTAYTILSGRDFSFMGAGLFSCLMCMIGYSFIAMLFGYSPGGLYSMFGAMLFCGFIIYDVDQTMNKIGLDDYVMATINIYLDIINLFLHILQLLSSNDR